MLKSKISENIITLSNFKESITATETEAQDEIGKIRYSQQELCKAVDVRIDVLMQKLEAHRQELKGKITSIDDGCVQKLNKYIATVKDLKYGVETKLEVLKELLKSHEITLLKDSSEKEEMKLPEFPVIDRSISALGTSAELDPNLYVSLHTNNGFRYLAGKNYEVVKKCEQIVTRMCEFDGNIWVTNMPEGYVKVYS
jgi:hypothetical protein